MHIAHFPDSPRPEWPWPVVALGNFDGLHRGHLRVIDDVRTQAALVGGTAAALMFDPHPPRVLRPDHAPRLLMTLDQRLEACERAGLDAIAIVRFTPDLARWAPDLFVETVLVDWLRVAEVRVGANFLFGRDRAGTFTLLRTLGEALGFRTEKIEPVRYKDFVVSSTRIRHLVSEGRVDEAGAMLGHHYFIDGVVVRGDGRGRELGFPTANMTSTNELIPPHGIYATVAVVDGVAHRAVSSLGVRPTIGPGPATIETHLLDVSPDLYGRRMCLFFVKWLRAEERFDSLESLVDAMGRDCRRARDLFDALTV